MYHLYQGRKIHEIDEYRCIIEPAHEVLHDFSPEKDKQIAKIEAEEQVLEWYSVNKDLYLKPKEITNERFGHFVHELGRYSEIHFIQRIEGNPNFYLWTKFREYEKDTYFGRDKNGNYFVPYRFGKRTALQLQKHLRYHLVEKVFYIHKSNWQTHQILESYFKSTGDKDSNKYHNYLCVSKWSEERVASEFINQEIPELPKLKRFVFITGEITVDSKEELLRSETPVIANV
jgi:hypothetical protein